MIYTVHIYSRKHGTSNVEQLEVPYNYAYGKDIAAQKTSIPPVPPPKKAR